MTHAAFAIEPQLQAHRVVLHLSGELDLAARETLLQEGERLAGQVPVVLDCSDVRFIDASVVGALFYLARLARERGGCLAVVDGQSADRSIWRLTRYLDVCPVHVSIQEATAALGE